jgi:hypothetical protein
MSDTVKLDRMLRGDWRYNDWVHLSLADFFPVDAASGAARYPSEAAGTASRGHSQRSLLALQLENLARVYTVLFGSAFEGATSAIVNDLRDRRPRFTDISVDYLYARIHEQLVAFHGDIVKEDHSKAFGTPINTPADAVCLLQKYLAAADLRPAMEQLFMRQAFPLILRGARPGAGGRSPSPGSKRATAPASTGGRQRPAKVAKSVSFVAAAATAPALAPRPPTPQGRGAAAAVKPKPAHAPAAPRSDLGQTVRTVGGYCLWNLVGLAGAVNRKGELLTCRTREGTKCDSGSHAWPTAGRAPAVSGQLTAAAASGATLAGGPDNIALVVRRLARNAK